MANHTTKSQEPRIREEELQLGDPRFEESTPEENRLRREKTIARLRLLWNHAGFLGRCVGIGLVLSLIVALITPNMYTSTARLMPPDQSAGAGLAMLTSLAGKAGGGSLASLGSELLGFRTSADLFAGILKSETVEDDVVTKFDLQKVYHHSLRLDARKELASRTDVEVDRKTEIISIGVTDKSPRRAQAIAQEYVNALNQVVTDLNTGSAHRERVFLDERLAEVKKDLEASEKQFSQFASKNTALDIETQARAMISAVAALQGQLIATETELEELKTLYTPNNVRVREAQARADELRRQIQKLGGKPGGTNAAPLQDSATLSPAMRELPLLGVPYADLYRNTKVEEAIFETLTQQDEIAKVEEAKETPSVKELDPPQVPEKKSSPHRLLIVLAATILAAGFGTAWVLGTARWRETDSNDPGKLLAQEVFQSIRSHLPRQSRNGAGSDNGNAAGSGENTTRDSEREPRDT